MAAREKIKLISALAVIGLSFLAIYASLHGFGPPIEAASQKALGRVLATEALKLRGPGGKILVLSQDTSTQPNPYADAQLRAFERTLKKNSASIATNHLLRLNPIRLISVPASEFTQLLKKTTENDVLVSFLGPPIGYADQNAGARDKGAKILAVCQGGIGRQADLRHAFEQGWVTAAIISRPDASRLSGPTPLETFNQNFSVITAANITELPLASSPQGNP